jgi:hypothetical protein
MPFEPAVDRCLRAGVAGVASVVDGWSETDWARPACGIWDGTDLAGHLVTVVGWYHRWLDRAADGVTEPVFTADRLDEETARSLAALPSGSGPERVATFVVEADRHADRLAPHWDTPFGYPRGVVTAGAHAALAAWEWHVHAWDLAGGSRGTYRPADAALMLERGTACFEAATGIHVPAEPGDPWLLLLRRTGRAV